MNNEENGTNGKNKRVVGTASAESILIEKRLMKLQIGDVLNYSEINELVPGADVQTDQRGWLMTAERRCESQGVFIRCVPKIGVQRVSDNDESRLWINVTDKCRRATRKGRRRLAKVNYDTLKPEEKLSYHMGLTVMGAAEVFMKPKNQTAIADTVERTQKALSFDETIAAFKK